MPKSLRIYRSVTLPWHEFLSDCALLLQKNGWNYTPERYVELLERVLQTPTCVSVAEQYTNFLSACYTFRFFSQSFPAIDSLLAEKEELAQAMRSLLWVIS
jgi:hypothetical protein